MKPMVLLVHKSISLDMAVSSKGEAAVISPEDKYGFNFTISNEPRLKLPIYNDVKATLKLKEEVTRV